MKQSAEFEESMERAKDFPLIQTVARSKYLKLNDKIDVLVRVQREMDRLNKR